MSASPAAAAVADAAPLCKVADTATTITTTTTAAAAATTTTTTVPDTDCSSDSELSELEGYDTDPYLLHQSQEDHTDADDDNDDDENDDEDGDEGEEDDDDERNAWESESVLEDALDELRTEVFDPGVCVYLASWAV